MRDSHRNRVFALILATLSVGFLNSTAAAQNYVFGTASYAAPGLTSSSPPLGNVPIITADFNGDGIPDLAILGSTSSAQVISIFLGKPDGTFALRVDYDVQASGFTVGDFNGDGKLDIIVANNAGLPPASILLGNGDGTFQSPTPLNQTIPNGVYSTVASADLRGDGKRDLVFLGSTATMLVLLGNGDGTFETPASYALSVATYMAMGDFNGDGKPDMAVAGYNYSTQSSQIFVFINHGDGTFLSPVSYDVAGEVQTLAVADLNGDGKLDLVAPTGGTTAGVSVLLGIGDGTFANPVTYTSTLLSVYSTSVAVADFNGDGKLDLALTNSESPNNAVAILLGKGDGTFQNPPLLYSAGLEPAGVVALDMNGDGKPDLAVVGGYFVGPYYSVTVLINQGEGTFPHGTVYPALKYPWTAVQGDFNGDGKPDIAVASITANSTGQDTGGAVSVLLGNGDGTFQPRVDSTTSNFPFVIAAGDFNGDGKLDLVVVEGIATGDLLSTWIGNGDGTFQQNISQSLPTVVSSLAVGDFNHDGKLDVAAVMSSASAVSIFLGIGNGTFSAPVQYATGPTLDSPPLHNVLTGDFNGDGNLDLAVSTDSGISILLGKGDGTFRPYSAILPGESLLAVGDFNGDGKPDLAIATSNNIVSVALGKGDGTFQQASGYQLPSILEFSSPTVGDFNGDGKLDIAFASQSADVVTILFGNGDGTFSHHMELGTAQVPALVAADFNGDGALDLAMTDVTNQQVEVFLNSPVAAFFPSRLNFASETIGTPSAEQTVSMSNPSPVPISLASIGTTGDFSPSDSCGSKLMPLLDCQVSVTFTPTADGARSGTLVFTDSVPGSPQSVPISGTGTGTEPVVSLSSPPTFPSQGVGITSSAQTVTLTNAGNANLTLTAVGATTPFAIASSGTTCSTANPVAAQASCTVAVTFTPTAAGSASGSLTFTDNAPQSPQKLALTGTGVDFSLAVAAGSSSSATVTPGQTASYSLSLSGLGGMSQSINFTCAGAPSEATCTVNPASMSPAAAGPETLTVTVTTTAPGVILPPSRRAPPLGPEINLRLISFLFLVLLAFGWLAVRRLGGQPHRRTLYGGLAMAALVLLAVAMAACGGGGGGGGGGGSPNPGTPAGTYTLTITGATSGSAPLQHSMTLTLTVS